MPGYYTSNVFVFTPDGFIKSMVLNAPDAMHGSALMEMCGHYANMGKWSVCFKISMVVDLTFKCTAHPYFIWGNSNALPGDNLNSGNFGVMAQATSDYQYVKWGMKIFKTPFLHVCNCIK